MQILYFILKFVIRELKRFILRKGFYCRILTRYPNINIVNPVNWVIDDLNSLEIGNNVSLGPFSEIAVLQNSPYSKINGKLVIGDNVTIGKGANIRAGGGEIHIGTDTLIAQNVSIIAANHSTDVEGFYRNTIWDESRTGVFIDTNVWIGANVTILPGVKIGKNAIIGAGSIITKNIGNSELWSGFAATRKRKLASKS